MKKVTIEVTPQTLHTLKRAKRLYEGIALGEFKVYDQAGYKFHDPDRAIMCDAANELKRLSAEITPQVSRIK